MEASIKFWVRNAATICIANKFISFMKLMRNNWSQINFRNDSVLNPTNDDLIA